MLGSSNKRRFRKIKESPAYREIETLYREINVFLTREPQNLIYVIVRMQDPVILKVVTEIILPLKG